MPSEEKTSRRVVAIGISLHHTPKKGRFKSPFSREHYLYVPISIFREMNFYRNFFLTLLLALPCFTHAQNFDWVRTVNGSLMDECNDVTVSSNTGFIYSTGYFTTSTDFPNGMDTLTVTSFNNCAYVAKYDVYGDIIWLKTLPSSTNGKSKGNGIAVDANDNVIVVGDFNGSIDFDPADSTENIQTATNSDAFIWKLDLNGNFQWVKRVNSSYEVAAFGVTADTNNNIVFSGLYNNSASMPGAFSLSDNDNRGYICKLDSAGNYQWVNSLMDVPGDIYPSNVRADADNNYYVTGAYVQNSSPTIGFLQKVSTNGQDSWRVELGNPSGVGFINDVVCSPYGVFVCGSFKNQASIGGAVGSHFVTSNGNYFDALAFKLNRENGQPIWSTTFGSSSDDYGSAINTDANGNVYVAGRFRGTANYANMPQATLTANGSDAYVWKLDYTGEGIGGYSLTNAVDDEITTSAICTATDGAIYVAGRSYGTTDFDHDLIDMEEHTSYGYSDGYLHRTTDCDAFLQPAAQEVIFCQEDSVEINGVYYSEPQLLTTDSLISQWGCDSIITFQLMNYLTNAYAFYSICRGDSIMTASGMVHEAGEYVSEYTSFHGCDSSFIEIVEWIPSSHIFETYTLCQDSLLSIYNETITAAGEYLFLVENTQTTCRDTVSVSVNLTSITGEVAQQGNTLVAEETAYGYAWLDCMTGAIIPGANNQQYSPDNSGSYAVIINNEGCQLTGSCVDIEVIGIEEAAAVGIEIYPNPADDLCYIRSIGSGIIQIELMDATGKEVKTVNIIDSKDSTYTLHLHEIPSGIYTLLLTLSNQNTRLVRLAIQ